MKAFQMIGHAGGVASVCLHRDVAGGANGIVLVQLVKVVPNKASFLSLRSGHFILFNVGIL